jgi:hypothetical protein
VLAWMTVFLKMHTFCTLPYIENSSCCQTGDLVQFELCNSAQIQLQISDSESSLLLTARSTIF